MAVPDCPNCLGSGQCWVCLGHGLIDRPGDKHPIDKCQRCFGTGKCTDCGPTVTVQDLEEPPPLLERRARRRFRLRREALATSD